MACDRNDLWLFLSRYIHIQEHFPDASSGLVPIHERHVAVHEDQRVFVIIALVDAFLYNFDCLLPVVGEFSKFLPLLEP